MRIAQYTSYGDPAEVIGVVEVPDPLAAAGEAVVRVDAAPIHLADLYCMRGLPSFRMPLPATPGFEGVGTVIQLGDGVDTLTLGQRVMLPMGTQTWAEQLAAPAAQFAPAPPGRLEELALLPINPPTSYLILEDYGDLQAGDWVIQNAANSNCGRYLIQLARLRGIKTVNVVRRKELIPELAAIGGDVVLLDGDDLAARVAQATDGAAIRLAVDAVNGAATTRLAQCLADGGTVLIYGMLTGEPCQLPADLVFLRDIRMEGFYTIRSFETRSAGEIKAIYEHLGQLLSDGTLSAKIAATYSLDQLADAVTHAGRKGAERDGKIILLPNGG
jgi:trans-2-enoyl-CoA reductase